MGTRVEVEQRGSADRRFLEPTHALSKKHGASTLGSNHSMRMTPGAAREERTRGQNGIIMRAAEGVGGHPQLRMTALSLELA